MKKNFISFHDVNPAGTFLWVSPMVLETLGYEPEELIGMSVYKIIVPEDIPLSRVVHKENLMNDLVASQTTVRGVFLWISPSIFHVLGYTPEELIGRSGYDPVLPEDRALSRVVHKENLMNDLVASQVVVRYVAKDGHHVPCICVFSLCYDFVLNCVTMVDPSAGAFHQKLIGRPAYDVCVPEDIELGRVVHKENLMNDLVASQIAIRHLRAHSAAMTHIVGSKKEEFERLKRHHQAFADNLWNDQGMEPEPRICMILNRFSRNLLIMYASPACEIIFNIDPEQIVGKPILLFVRADDLGSFVEQVDVIKSSTAIMHMRFWFQSPNCSEEIPCEAMLFGCADGVVALMRRCKPFVRRRLIGGNEHYKPSNNIGIISRDSSWSSTSPSSNSSTPATSITSSPPIFKSPTCPSRNAPMSRIKKIKIVDKEDDRITRPLEEVINTDPDLAPEVNYMPAGFGIKEYRMQDYEENDDDDVEETRINQGTTRTRSEMDLS
ncbi:hypothetical protein BGX27_005275 [Mortierella sp. AM989]|nr:hypothetical protein BGX27_005275 [Mortierella sp. AM989]